MKLLVGLGNPGAEYVKTRHNAGFMAIDLLAERHGSGQIARSKFNAMLLDVPVSGHRCLLMKPVTYMNRSGQAIAEACRFYKLDASKDVLVLVDDVALPCGTVRLKATGGAGGHNGLTDIARKLGSENYARLRIGIDEKPPVMRLEDYVLGRFTEEQMDRLTPALKQAADAAEVFAAEGIDAAMNRFNTKNTTAGWGKEAEPEGDSQRQE
ncbi:MAG: aminoacyl-tRNA hydrolase [Phycisphaerales bacterium]|nr:aminoacyl-tRNA hydrolase [Phycisphaerales bacterium]MCB9835476.1 aminoacyl-tRNA hydrolase [Phycisphaera sp.]